MDSLHCLNHSKGSIVKDDAQSFITYAGAQFFVVFLVVLLVSLNNYLGYYLTLHWRKVLTLKFHQLYVRVIVSDLILY
jgi:ABC-type uncharacterized transport system fused permease/ATPase subunit